MDDSRHGYVSLTEIFICAQISEEEQGKEEEKGKGKKEEKGKRKEGKGKEEKGKGKEEKGKGKEEKEETEIHPVLKSRYIELILVMFVAVGRNRSFLGHICYSFVSTDYLSMILTLADLCLLFYFV